MQEFTTEFLSDLKLDSETIESARKAAAETAARTVSCVSASACLIRLIVFVCIYTCTIYIYVCVCRLKL